MITLKNGGIKIMKQVIIIAIGLSVGFLIGMCLVEFHKYTTASTAYILDLRKQVDSLTMEIQLRDVLLSKYKDTSYGEEPIYIK
jgi:hypothetical protein